MSLQTCHLQCSGFWAIVPIMLILHLFPGSCRLKWHHGQPLGIMLPIFNSFHLLTPLWSYLQQCGSWHQWDQKASWWGSHSNLSKSVEDRAWILAFNGTALSKLSSWYNPTQPLHAVLPHSLWHKKHWRPLIYNTQIYTWVTHVHTGTCGMGAAGEAEPLHRRLEKHCSYPTCLHLRSLSLYPRKQM